MVMQKVWGKIGLKTIIYFEIVTTLALIIGLTTANIFKPGIGFVTSNSIYMLSSHARSGAYGCNSGTYVD